MVVVCCDCPLPLEVIAVVNWLNALYVFIMLVILSGLPVLFWVSLLPFGSYVKVVVSVDGTCVCILVEDSKRLFWSYV